MGETPASDDAVAADDEDAHVHVHAHAHAADVSSAASWGDAGGGDRAPGDSPVGDPTACVGLRVVAYLIDTLVLLIPTIVIVVLMVVPPIRAYLDALRHAAESGAGPASAGLPPLGTLFGAELAILALNLAYFAGFEAVISTTPGKALFGLVVVRPDGTTPIGPGKALIRDVILIVADGFPIGLIVALLTKGHQRIGDLVSGCYVVPKQYANRFVELWPPDGAPPWTRPEVPPV